MVLKIVTTLVFGFLILIQTTALLILVGDNDRPAYLTIDCFTVDREHIKCDGYAINDDWSNSEDY